MGTIITKEVTGGIQVHVGHMIAGHIPHKEGQTIQTKECALSHACGLTVATEPLARCLIRQPKVHPIVFFWCTHASTLYVATMTDAELGEHSPPKMGGVNWYMGRTQL